MMYSDFELAQIEVETLFVHNTDGKLLGIKEPASVRPAPRFFLVRTRSGHLWRTRYDLPTDLAHKLGQLAADEPLNDDLSEIPRYAAQYTKLLEQHAPVMKRDTGIAYYLPEHDLPHQATMITSENASLANAYFPWLMNELADCAPVAATVIDGQAVALCFCSRITARAATAGIETEVRYRGRGYATIAAYSWLSAVRASGRMAFYDTSWTNYASQSIARKLGGVHYATNFSIT